MKYINKRSLLIVFFLTAKNLASYSQDIVYPVKEIAWNDFNTKMPNHPIIEMTKSALLNVNKFALGEWYQNIQQYQTDSTNYLELKSKGNINERRYRLPAGMAFGLAISLKTGIYNEELTKVPFEQAVKKTKLLFTSVAFDHRSNGKRSIWGGDWQAAHWAYYSGYAAWLLWYDLEADDRKYVQNMIIYEANRLLKLPPLFYKDNKGKSLVAGDSKIEEDAWNAELLYLASVMLPTHPNGKLWYQQSIAYMIAATAMSADLSKNKIMHGKPVKNWLSGYNVEEPGVVVNHHIIHPLYNALSSVVNAPIVFSLAKLKTPEAARFNIHKIYSSLINTKFSSPPYKAPGGAMYVQNKAEIYYPEGSDWGVEIYDSFANLDIAAWLYGYDHEQKYKGHYWAKLHVGAVTRQQSRFKDGHTYLDETENNYYGREAAVSTRMGSAWMSIWLQYQYPVVFTNEAVFNLPNK